MPAGNNNFVDTDAKIKDFLNAVLSSEGIVVDIRRTFINYNGVNRSRVFARRANEMASKGGNEKFVVIALMCYPALQWILQAQDIDRLVEELREQNPDESVSRMSNIQRVLESSLGGCKPQLRLEMRKVFFARCQQLVDAVDEAMNAAVFHNPKSKAGKISLAMALLRGSILETDPVTAVTIRTHFDSIIEDVAAMAGDTIKPLVMQLAPNEGNAESSEAAFLFHNTEVLLKEYSRIHNLTASCPRCNRKKSDSGGFWIFLGRFGIPFYFCIWMLLLAFTVWFALQTTTGTLPRGFLLEYLPVSMQGVAQDTANAIVSIFKFR